jgi:serine/threonine-protein kinase RsbW
VTGTSDGRPLREARFLIRATLAEVSALGSALRAFRSGHDRCAECHIEIGIIEALTNVVEHGYAAGADATIAIRYSEYPDRLVTEIVDHGRPIPLDRMEKADAEVFAFDPTDTCNLPEGGLGLSLIRALFDVVEYSSAPAENRLRLTKTIA